MLTKKITVKNPSGLHMRPAGMLVKIVTPFQCKALFYHKDNEYNARSMISVLSAAIKQGDEIELRFNGADEQACCDAVVAAIESGLGE